MSRESFLKRVRDAAQAGQAYRVHVDPFPPDTSYVGYQGDICEAFVAEAEAVGAHCYLVDDNVAAIETVDRLVENLEVRRSLLWEHSLLDAIGVVPMLESRSIAVHCHKSLKDLDAEQRRSIMLECEVGITSADYAIAETGSLAVCSKPGQERLASLLTPVHIAVITREQIVPDIIDLFSEVGGRPLPSNLALITGPSKTGDIELQLTTGVHGPGNVHIVVIR